MRRVIVVGFGVVISSATFAVPVSAQESPPAATVDAAQVEGPAPDQPRSVEPGGATRFVRDVSSDYRQSLSFSTVPWLGFGSGAALAVHAADQALADSARHPDGASRTLPGGQAYGGLGVQVPLAIGWWLVGRTADSDRASAAGRDLLRAQINAVSWTYALKYSVSRPRPNGDPRSFPSGHTSSSFATAMVLQQHYGWRVGTPAFALATYTGASRLTDNKHWASDVVFGAFLGMASAHTVTVQLRGLNARVAPLAVPGGGGVVVNASR